MKQIGIYYMIEMLLALNFVTNNYRNDNSKMYRFVTELIRHFCTIDLK